MQTFTIFSLSPISKPSKACDQVVMEIIDEANNIGGTPPFPLDKENRKGREHQLLLTCLRKMEQRGTFSLSLRNSKIWMGEMVQDCRYC